MDSPFYSVGRSSQRAASRTENSALEQEVLELYRKRPGRIVPEGR